MENFIISGIQQAGVGVSDARIAYKWYSSHLGMDVPVFEESAEANLMLPYTGGQSHQRLAILAMNLRGGGGLEIWQYTSRTPEEPRFSPQLGDLGHFCAKIKTKNIERTFAELSESKVDILSEIIADPGGCPHFYIRDPFGNCFDIFESREFFMNGGKPVGGVAGMVIGVSDIDRSKRFYAELLGYDKVLFEGEARFQDLSGLPGGGKQFKRVVLTHTAKRVGPFSRMFGSTTIELIQAVDYVPRKIFENRFWGDLGFIHLCFDVRNLELLRKKCEAGGHPFTAESGADFSMGNTEGRFSYIEDPDGTLIEFVEANRIPIIRKAGWYLNLTKRNPEKPLPDWMLKAMRFNRKKTVA